MRKTIVIVTLVFAIAASFASCASSRGVGAHGGCKMSQGFVGYGGR
jgi:predicted small secreted protein